MAELKATYKGYELEVSKEKCMGGWSMVYFNIYAPDGYECVADFTEDNSPLRTHMKWLKERVDEELASDDPWGRAEEVTLESI